MSRHLEQHVNEHELCGDSTLHVVGVISNPVRWHSRYRIAREWIDAMAQTPGIKLHIVEAAFGDRKHELSVAPWAHVNKIDVRVNHEAWIKEGMVNLGLQAAIHKFGARYLAWVDADVFFRDRFWANHTVHALQHRDVVQPWSDCLDLGPHGSVLEHHKSFGYLNAHGIRRQRRPGEPYKFGHPGFAWACTRSFFENVRGLMDFPILGSADHHMGCAMVGEVDTSIHAGMSEGFKRRCHEWQTRAVRSTHKQVGYVPGRIEHHFHGPKARRYYRERWEILVEHCYDPDRDLRYDSQGLPYIHGKKALEHAIERYNRSRFEDSIEER